MFASGAATSTAIVPTDLQLVLQDDDDDNNSCASSHVAQAVTAATTVPLPVMAWSRLATNLMIRQGNKTAALLCKVRQNLEFFLAGGITLCVDAG